MDIPIIRLIERGDNQEMASIIRNVLEGHAAPKEGTAYSDVSLKNLFQTYQGPRSAYFVLVKNGKLLGGAGIGPLVGNNENICELQKMYFLPEARELGLGAQMMEFCIAKAREFKYDKIYLETMENMDRAQRLYQKYDFQYIDGALGNTGHYSCPVHMIKRL